MEKRDLLWALLSDETLEAIAGGAGGCDPTILPIDDLLRMRQNLLGAVRPRPCINEAEQTEQDGIQADLREVEAELVRRSAERARKSGGVPGQFGWGPYPGQGTQTPTAWDQNTPMGI